MCYNVYDAFYSGGDYMKKKKLLIQVAIVTSLFLAAVLIAVEVVLYMSTQNVYLRSKNEMITRDLKAMSSTVTETKSITTFFDYWKNNKEKIRPFTDEELSQLTEYWENTDSSFEWFTLDKPEEYFEGLDPIYMRDLCLSQYDIVVRNLLYKIAEYGYERYYLLDIGENSDGTVFTQYSKEEYDGQIGTIDYGLLGSVPDIDIYNTGAVKTLRTGEVGDTAFEALKTSDKNPLYAGYILIASKDDHRYAICVLYDWSGFQHKLNDSVLPSVLISALLIITANILLIRFLYVRSIRPVTKIQASVREYTDSKDTERIVNELAKIKAKNEFGELAADVSHLADEINRYTTEIAQFAGEKERAAAELELATHIQAGSLPSVFPAFPDRNEFDLFASMDPAKEVGGDFYDFFMIDDDHLALAIADVSGKGIPAALFMMASKILLDDKAMLGGSPAEILEFVNERICSSDNDSMFVTMWLGILEISTGKLSCSNAGHEYPVIKRAGGDYELFRDKHSPAVGTMSGIPFKSYELTLEKGDALFVYTDGVPEATNSENELFGTDRMVEALNSAKDAKPRDLLRTLRASVDAFVGDAPQFDDLTMLTLQYFGK